jgi:septum formation protein
VAAAPPGAVLFLYIPKFRIHISLKKNQSQRCGGVVMKYREVILASGSPRRRELLAMAGVPFQVIPSDVEEKPQAMPPEELVQCLAQDKAHNVYARYGGLGLPVLAADTVVACCGEIFGKPHNREDAFVMLSRMSGRVHTVYTGVCVYFPEGRKVVFCEKTDVQFYELSPQEIEAYINTGEPMDKAGAYGIQGKGAYLVKEIHGDYYNVMGLPLARVLRLLRCKIEEEI